MAKSEALSDKQKYKIIEKELREFNKLVEGHRQLLEAIGRL